MDGWMRQVAGKEKKTINCRFDCTSLERRCVFLCVSACVCVCGGGDGVCICVCVNEVYFDTSAVQTHTLVILA